MNIVVNGERHATEAATLAALLVEIELEEATLATAHNGEFVAADERDRIELKEGDRIEILAPMQGG